MLALGLVALPIGAQAQVAPDTGPAAPADSDTIRLSDAERTLILNRNTEDSAAAARGEMIGSERSQLQVHGEIGAMIGSNGTRGIYGRADIPLGENAGATVMFESSRFGYRRGR